MAEGLPLVSMDMVLMTQVLVNLLDNALKYSPAESSIGIYRPAPIAGSCLSGGARPRPRRSRARSETDFRQVLPHAGPGRGRRNRPGAVHLQGDRRGP